MTLKAVVTDIEGTTSSIRFVHEVLFPYARKMLRPFLEAHGAEPEVQESAIAGIKVYSLSGGQQDKEFRSESFNTLARTHARARSPRPARASARA